MKYYNFKNKKASVLIYIVILVNIALIMAVVVASNTFLLESNYNLNNTNKALLS
jgi:t-SNARE complex subunit (syntaxin)